jgi:hypothetical protein
MIIFNHFATETLKKAPPDALHNVLRIKSRPQHTRQTPPHNQPHLRLISLKNKRCCRIIAIFQTLQKISQRARHRPRSPYL